MNLRQLIRRFRPVVQGGPEVEFVNVRAPRVYGQQLWSDVALVTYAAAMNIDARLGSLFIIVPTDGVAFAMTALAAGNPIFAAGLQPGQQLTIQIRNTTGGALGAATFTGGAGGFRIGAAWTQPATGFSRSIIFAWNTSVWVEVGRTAADVAN